MRELINKVLEWGRPKGLTDQRKMLDTWPQYEKVQEEVGEIGRAIAHGNMHGLADGIGDSVVTLILLAEQNNLDIEDCLKQAYDEIKDRKGRTIGGKFVKEQDFQGSTKL